MRRFRAPVVFALGFTLTGCQGTNASKTQTSTITSPTNSTCSTTAASGSMTAQINGVTWVATCVTTATWSNSMLSIDATDGRQDITLNVTANAPGTFSMTTTLANARVATFPASGTSWTASVDAQGSDGTLTISQLGTTGAAGTFSFTAVPTPGTGALNNKVVTVGTFSVGF